MYTARNVKPSLSWGLILGIIFTGIDQIMFRGKLPFTLKHIHADHETLIPAKKAKKIKAEEKKAKAAKEKKSKASEESVNDKSS